MRIIELEVSRTFMVTLFGFARDKYEVIKGNENASKANNGCIYLKL